MWWQDLSDTRGESQEYRRAAEEERTGCEDSGGHLRPKAEEWTFQVFFFFFFLLPFCMIPLSHIFITTWTFSPGKHAASNHSLLAIMKLCENTMKTSTHDFFWLSFSDLFSDLFLVVVISVRYELELKEEFIKRTEKLTENENRNKGECSNEVHPPSCFSSVLIMLMFLLFFSRNCSHPKGVGCNWQKIRGAQQILFGAKATAGKQPQQCKSLYSSLSYRCRI